MGETATSLGITSDNRLDVPVERTCGGYTLEHCATVLTAAVPLVGNVGSRYGSDWMSLFDLIVVNAKKRTFFEEHPAGTPAQQPTGTGSWYPASFRWLPSHAVSNSASKDVVEGRGGERVSAHAC